MRVNRVALAVAFLLASPIRTIAAPMTPSSGSPIAAPMAPGSGGPMSPASTTVSAPAPTCSGTGLLFNSACNSQYLGVTGL